MTLNNLKKFIGLHPMSKGETNGYTEADLKQLVGKEIVLRSPLYCKTKAPSFCAKCVGDSFAANPTGLHTSISDVGIVSFMSLCLRCTVKLYALLNIV